MPDPEWTEYSTSPQWGDNTQGTHSYQDSATVPEGKFEVKCKITLENGTIINPDIITIPWYSVLPDQKESNGSSFGSINYWYKGNFKDNNGLNEMYIPRYDRKVLQADINVVSSPPEKYNYWTGNEQNIYYNNFVSFNPYELLSTPMLSQFNYTRNATVRAKVDNYYLDVIQFKDPWLRDYNDEPFGIRNQGLSAQPKPLANIENNLAINTTHQGVLLNQEIAQDKPYYSINIQPSINLPQNGGTHNFYLQSWDISPSSNANFDNYTSLTPNVVFHNDVIITAILKAQGLSDDQNAYSSGSQRKFIKSSSGMPVNVYSSMGDIWLEVKPYSSWTINGGTPINSDLAKGPSLDYASYSYQGGEPVHELLVVFQQKSGSNSNIVIKYYEQLSALQNMAWWILKDSLTPLLPWQVIMMISIAPLLLLSIQ